MQLHHGCAQGGEDVLHGEAVPRERGRGSEGRRGARASEMEERAGAVPQDS